MTYSMINGKPWRPTPMVKLSNAIAAGFVAVCVIGCGVLFNDYTKAVKHYNAEANSVQGWIDQGRLMEMMDGKELVLLPPPSFMKKGK